MLRKFIEPFTFAPIFRWWGALTWRAENIPFEPDPGNAGVENLLNHETTNPWMLPDGDGSIG